MNMDAAGVMWRCEACKRMRPDSQIGLHKVKLGFMNRNVCYCLDTPACFEHALGITRKFSEKYGKQ